MISRITGSAMMTLVFCLSSAGAAEPPASEPGNSFVLPTDGAKIVVADGLGQTPLKPSFAQAKPDVRVALCGVEADAGNANLDTGLIDFNVPTSAHGAVNWSEGPRDAGRNVHDYPSPVFLGVTLGYKF